MGIAIVGNRHLRISRSINELSKEIEILYLSLGRRFPKLLNELESGFVKSNLVVSYFKKQESKKSHSSLNMIKELMDRAETVVRDASSYFLKMHEKDISIFESINDSIKSLNILKNRIEDIREDSIEVELLSMNAMVIAIKAGRAGKGFSFITDELKKVSSRTIDYTNVLTRQGGNLVDVFTEFQKIIENLEDFQKKFYTGFSEKLHKGFENFNSSVNQIAETLMQIIEKSRCVTEPLFRIMEELQLEDIMKQSLDHVMLTLHEIRNEAIKIEDSLNQYSTIEVLTDLCIKLLDDIKDKITGSFNVFQSNFLQLRKTLNDVEKERKDFIKKVADCSLDSRFDQSTESIKELIKNIEYSMLKKREISDYSRIIDNGFVKLEQGFYSFIEIINSFYSIEVASKIEIAKQDVLKERSGIIEKMTTLTDRIDKDVNYAMADIKDSLSNTGETLKVYAHGVNTESEVVQGFLDNIKKSRSQLAESRTNLENSIMDFSVYTDHFFPLLSASENDINTLYKKGDVIESLKKELAVIKKEAKDKKKIILKETGLDKWEIKDDNNIRKLIEKFTILTHKQAAGDLSGYSVENGDKAGDLTLF